MSRASAPFILLAALVLPGPAAGEIHLYVPTVAAVSVSANPVALGEAVTLTASVRERGSGRPVSAGVLALERAEAPEGPWVLLAEEAPDEAGSFQLLDRVSPLTPGLVWFRTRYAGHQTEGITYGEAVSPALPLVVKDYAGPPVELGVIHAAGDGEVGAHGLGTWELTLAVRVLWEVTELSVFQAPAPEALAGAARRWRLSGPAVGEAQVLTLKLAEANPPEARDPGVAPLTGEWRASARGAQGGLIHSDPAPGVGLLLPEGLAPRPPAGDDPPAPEEL
ncbi:MAG: hypothetical protein K6T55_09840 [Syntrophobacterales bacterium]|nr:hypothetical protein [Syntrophobacterales bacterium]